LPDDKILIAGDLVTHPVLYTYDGYPSEWIETLTRMEQLDARAIVPGHGDVVTDTRFLVNAQNLLRSAVDQVRARLAALSATIEYPSLDEVRKDVDLSPFRQSFAQGNAETAEAFDAAAAALVRVAYNEAMHNR
jgi:glyoxylase-like metal-dependent hydrolase (beta-lactamase superfamily II)